MPIPAYIQTELTTLSSIANKRYPNRQDLFNTGHNLSKSVFQLIKALPEGTDQQRRDKLESLTNLDETITRLFARCTNSIARSVKSEIDRLIRLDNNNSPNSGRRLTFES